MSLPNKPLLVSELPRFGFLGRNIMRMVVQIASRMNFPKKCLIITGPITRDVAGKDCEQILKSEDFDPLMHIVPSATLEEAHNLTNFIIEVNPDFLVAVGGGKIADVSKWASKDAEMKSDKVYEIIGVPTTVSHDGFFSPYCFLKAPLVEHSDILVESFIGKARSPVGLVADTQRIESCGFRNLFSGFAHLMSTLTSLWDWKLANRVRGSHFSDFGAALSSVGSDLLDGDDQIPRISSMDQAIRLIMKPLYISGMGMCLSNSIRVAFGSEHLFAEALARLTPSIETLHGERVGLGAIMSAYLQDQDWMRIRDLLRAVGAPVSASDLGIDPEVIVNALMDTHKISPPDIYTVFGDHGLNAQAAEKLALNTGVFS